MKASVHAFLSQIIDYAGLFPPAKLSMEDALGIYLHEKATSPHRWMLGRFVCPAARLQECLTLAWAQQGIAALHLTALAKQSSEPSDFLPELHKDLDEILEFHVASGFPDIVDAVEISLPTKASVELVADRIELATAQIRQAKLRGYLEVPRSASWREYVQSALEIKSQLANGEKTMGLKLRCGGITADAFPSDSQVAFFIRQCRTAGIPWKATAGLHHPRRHWDATLNLWHHGFLNVFGAGVLAWTHPLTEADIVEILADRDGLHFCFDEDAFAWKSWSCTTAQITEAREKFATSFGSCSFEEPCQDLQAMGLLDAKT